MHVLEVRNAELIESFTKQAAEHGITDAAMAIQGDRAVAGHLHKAHIGTWFAHAYVIPSTHHITLRANERVVLGE